MVHKSTTFIPGGAGIGTVTEVDTGTGLTGGPITTTGTISLANTTVTPGSYTSTDLTVDAQGRITAASNGSGAVSSISNSDGTLTISPTIGAVVASLALGNANTWTGKQIFNTSSVQMGTLSPNTALVSDASKNIISSATTATEIGYVSGVTSSIQTQINGKQATGNYITDLTGDVTASGPGSAAAILATVNGNTGSFGSSTSIPNFTVNGKGLLTAAGGNPVIAPAGTLTGTTLASNVITSSLTTVGTIGTGAWQGTIISPTYGGTGVNNGSNSLTIGASASVSGTNTGDQLTFKTFSVSGQSDIVADTISDTMTLVAGSGVTITTDASTDSITFNATGTGGTVTTTGSPVSGNLTKFSGASSITNGDLSGDVTTSGTLATTLATVNANTGTFGSSTSIPTFTVNGKGLITAASGNAVIAPAGTLTGATLAANVLASSLTSVGTLLNLTVTNTITGSISGNAGTVTIADAGGDTTTFPLLGTSATGSLTPATDAGLTYNATTNALTAGSFVGPLTGNADTATTATNATNVNVVDAASDTTTWVMLAGSQTGNTPVLSDAGITFNASTNALTATTFIGALTGNASTATALQTPRTIGAVSFDGTANIVPQTIESANEATDTTCFPLFITASGTQQLQPKNNTTLTFNSNTSNLAATTFTGALSGNASTATALQNARTIGGVSFDGTANIVPQTIQSINESTDTTCFLLFISAPGTQSLQPLNNAGLTYNSNTNNLTATTFTGALSGNSTTATTATNATNIAVVDAASDTTTWVVLAGSQTGNTPPLSDAGLTFNASTNALTTTTFVGALSGNASTATAATKITITEDGTTNAEMNPVWVTTRAGDQFPYATDKFKFNPSTITLSAERFVAGVSPGTAPFTVSSSTKVTNLNADLLDGKDTGTSGNTIPLLDGINTWSGNQTLGGTTKLLSGSIGELYNDATNFILNPVSGVISIGPTATFTDSTGGSVTGSTQDIMLDQMGLGGSPVDTKYWLNFDQTSNDALKRGAMAFFYNSTSSGSIQVSLYSKSTQSGSAASPLHLPVWCHAVMNQDNSGTSTSGFRSTIDINSGFVFTQGTHNFNGIEITTQTVGGTHTGGTIRRVGVKNATYAALTLSGATATDWGAIYGNDHQVNSDVKSIVEGGITTKGDSYHVFNSATTDWDFFVDNTKVLTLDNDAIDAVVMFRPSVGTATAGTAPIKMTSGTLLSTPEAGAIEFDGTNFYFTV